MFNLQQVDFGWRIKLHEEARMPAHKFNLYISAYVADQTPWWLTIARYTRFHVIHMPLLMAFKYSKKWVHYSSPPTFPRTFYYILNLRYPQPTASYCIQCTIELWRTNNRGAWFQPRNLLLHLQPLSDIPPQPHEWQSLNLIIPNPLACVSWKSPASFTLENTSWALLRCNFYVWFARMNYFDWLD